MRGKGTKRGNGTKLGEGERAFRDYYANPDSGKLRLGILHSGIVRGALLPNINKISMIFVFLGSFIDI